MTDARTKEAIRYLGYGRHAVDEQTLALIDVSFGELDQTTQAKSVYRIFDCKVTGEDQVTIGKMNIKSRSLASGTADRSLLFPSRLPSSHGHVGIPLYPEATPSLHIYPESNYKMSV